MWSPIKIYTNAQCNIKNMKEKGNVSQDRNKNKHPNKPASKSYSFKSHRKDICSLYVVGIARTVGNEKSFPT